eukprot:1869168-Rhodomonas_salina.2
MVPNSLTLTSCIVAYGAKNEIRSDVTRSPTGGPATRGRKPSVLHRHMPDSESGASGERQDAHIMIRGQIGAQTSRRGQC